jgi:hypothetical protein
MRTLLEGLYSIGSPGVDQLHIKARSAGRCAVAVIKAAHEQRVRLCLRRGAAKRADSFSCFKSEAA